MVQKTLQSNITCGSMDHQKLQMDEFLSSKLWMKCRNPNLGLTTKVRACKGASQN
jgi:hypothetical protein